MSALKMNVNKCKMFCALTGFLILSASLSEARSPALILTPYLKANQTELARKASLVDPSLFLNIKSYSGFFTVDKKYNSNIFFWYFPVVGKPLEETPWIVWLQGGPGASSIAGLFDEIGPFQIVNRALILRNATWTKDHSVLFIDNPVGAGYSFTDSPAGFIKDMPTCATHLYKVLQQFLTIFPEHRKAPLYLAGESYAGRYLPALGIKIMDQDDKLGPLDVNLQGIMMGNPVLNRDVISDYTGIYQQWGLIDTQGALAVKPIQDNYTAAIVGGNSAQALALRNILLDRLSEISMQLQNFNVLSDNIDLKSFIEYITHSQVSEAIHVGSIKFTFSNATVHDQLVGDFLSEVNSKVERLLERYRILIYCGQLDLTAPCVPNAQDRRRNWKWDLRNEFLTAQRVPWWYNNTVAGYVKSGGRFTEVLVRDAGHLVPFDKPEQLLQLISFFIRGLDMPLPPNYQPDEKYTPPYQPINSNPTHTTDNTTSGSSGTTVAMGVSIFINIILIVAILAGLVYMLRWRRRTEMFMYNNVEETSITEGVLTMS